MVIHRVWAVQSTVTKHKLLICNKQITEDCNTVTPEPQTAERYHADYRPKADSHSLVAPHKEGPADNNITYSKYTNVVQ